MSEIAAKHIHMVALSMHFQRVIFGHDTLLVFAFSPRDDVQIEDSITKINETQYQEVLAASKK